MTAEQAYWKALDDGWSQELEQIVINSGDPKWACMFARNINRDVVDISKLERVVMDSKNPEWAYEFAYGVFGANISKLEQIVIDSGDPYWACWFAINVKIKKSDFRKLEQVVIDSGDLESAHNLIIHTDRANIFDLIDFVLINDPELIKQLFDNRPDLKRKYEMGK